MRSKPVPRSFHWFCSLSTNNFPRTLCTVSSSSSPVNTREKKGGRQLQLCKKVLQLNLPSCSAHFAFAELSPHTPDPPSGSSSSSPPEPEPALSRSPNVFSAPALPSRQLLLSPPHSLGATLSLSPRARFAAGPTLAPNRPWPPPAAYTAKGFDRAPVPGPGEPER